MSSWVAGLLRYWARKNPATQELSNLVITGLLIALAIPAFADCISTGHHTIASSPWPYTEDLASKGVFVPFRADGAWTLVQSGCADNDERNVLASVPVNLMLRASLHVTSAGSAPAGTRYEVQLRVGTSADDPNAIIAATESRTVAGLRSERFAALVPQLPAGEYVYSMWVRVLDGPEANMLAVNLLWITAQGVPLFFPAARAESDRASIGSEWTRVGPPLTIAPPRQVDVSLHAAIDSIDGSAPAAEVAWTLDGESPAEDGIVALPQTGVTIFDDKRAVARGVRTLQLWMRSAGGAAAERIRVEAVSLPYVSVWPTVLPAQNGEASDEIAVTPAGDAVQPIALSPVCGRWTKILELDVPPSDGSFSWTLSGYAELIAIGGSVQGQVAIEGVHADSGVATDMGIFDFDTAAGRDGFFFYGDCSKWGNFGNGGRIAVRMRLFDGCGLPPANASVSVGRRRLTVKLLPSPTPHL